MTSSEGDRRRGAGSGGPPGIPKRISVSRWVAWIFAACALAQTLSGCGGDPPASGWRLFASAAGGFYSLAGDESSRGIVLPAKPDLAGIEIASERRMSVLMEVASWSWRGRVPRQARFTVGVGVPPSERPGVHRLSAQVSIRRGNEVEVAAVGRRVEPGWIDLEADLSEYAGDEVTITVEPRLEAASRADGRSRRLAYSYAGLAPQRPPQPRKPNIVLILVDTLRADHLTPYGYQRPTSPRIQELLADRGTVVETAYAPAPWTLPSMVALMTGRYPGELLDGPMGSFGIPDGLDTLSERLGKMGYQTGAFYANFLLRDSNGFGRGFASRYTPPAEVKSNTLHADSLQERVLPWVRANERRPFFLYVHYLDPHDPYVNPDLEGGRSPFFPDYSGKLTGNDVHGVYVGRRPLENPQADVAHLTALYDSEIRYVDRFVGELIESFDPEVAANTVFVLTSDHGEELFDHGGWKHGQTLYDEQIRIPLIVRADGRVKAGERLAGTVRLLDLFPTLITAAGGGADAAAHGVDLWPTLTRGAPLPRRPAFVQGLSGGPRRAAAVLGGSKLILFNRAAPFTPGEDRLLAHLWSRDLERLERREVYDLEADPRELENLAGRDPTSESLLDRVVEHRLNRAVVGLKWVVSGLPAGSRLSGRIVLEKPPSSWSPWFLSESDVVEVGDGVVDFEWTGDADFGGASKGLLLSGDAGGIRSMEVRLDGEPLARGQILVGEGRPYAGGPLDAADLRAAGLPPRPEGLAIRLWTRDRAQGAPGGAAAVDPEVEKSLRALGYIQ